jgi:hypothetical protein
MSRRTKELRIHRSCLKCDASLVSWVEADTTTEIKWIALGRSMDSPDWQTGAGIGRCLSNEGVGQVRGFYEAMGFDDTDDDDTIQYGDSQFPLTY